MQTKSSYRLLKWTFFAAMATSLASACVVSSGDGDGDDTDIDDGGKGGKSSTSGGKGGTGGTTSGGKGGTGGGGTTSGGTGTDGGTATAGGEGGTPPTYTAGLCDSELGTDTPSDLPSCEPTEKDETDACFKCMKESCCEEWQACYGRAPTTACGWGATSPDDLGQFDCIQQCFVNTFDGIQDEAELLAECESTCLNQCESTDEGFSTAGTQDLLICTRDACLTECYPAME